MNCKTPLCQLVYYSEIFIYFKNNKIVWQCCTKLSKISFFGRLDAPQNWIGDMTGYLASEIQVTKCNVGCLLDKTRRIYRKEEWLPEEGSLPVPEEGRRIHRKEVQRQFSWRRVEHPTPQQWNWKAFWWASIWNVRRKQQPRHQWSFISSFLQGPFVH